jgi:hypothetical protein
MELSSPAQGGVPARRDVGWRRRTTLPVAHALPPSVLPQARPARASVVVNAAARPNWRPGSTVREGR